MKVQTILYSTSRFTLTRRKTPRFTESYLIHCVPPPPPVHSLLWSTGSLTARHRERSDITGQVLTNTTEVNSVHSQHTSSTVL